MEDGFSNNNKNFTLVTDNIQNKFYSHTTCLFLYVFIHIKMYLPFIFYITIYQLTQMTCTCLKKSTHTKDSNFSISCAKHIL